MLTCKDASHAIASDELSTAGWRRRWQVRLHLLMCRHCRAYAAQIRALGRAAKDLFGGAEPDTAALERVEGEIFKQLGEVTESPSTEDGDDPV